MGKAAEKADEQEGAAVMAKNRIKISILGSDYIIASEEEENYVRQVAAETEKRIAGITRDNPRLSVTMAAVLAALDYCDEAVKATESADNLRSQIKDYLEDSSQARMEADEARRENEKLKGGPDPAFQAGAPGRGAEKKRSGAGQNRSRPGAHLPACRAEPRLQPAGAGAEGEKHAGSGNHGVFPVRRGGGIVP